MNFKNKKGAVATTLNFLLKLMLFLVITGSAVYIFNNVALADIRCQNSARNLGVAFDTLALSAKDMTFEVDCPSDIEFKIDGSRIVATTSSLIGEGFAYYSYMHESNAILPLKKNLTCISGAKIEVSKTYDSSLRPVIRVR